MHAHLRARLVALAAVSAAVLLACLCGSGTSISSQPTPDLEGHWQWDNMAFTIAWDDGAYRVTSANDAEVGTLEVPGQSWDGKTLSWTYTTPVSRQPATVTVTSVSGDVMWADLEMQQSGIRREGARFWRISSATPVFHPLPYDDDFTDRSGGWAHSEDEDGAQGYQDGAYYVVSKNSQILTLASANRYFSNVMIDVDAEPAGGPADNNFSYGVVCDIQNGGGAYSFEVRADGSYAVWVRSSSEAQGTTALSGDHWMYVDDINQGLANNHLRVVCADGLVYFEINGQQVFALEDHTFSAGDIGFFVGTHDPGNTPAQVRFDNLMVSKP